MTSPNKQSFIEFVKEHLDKDFYLRQYQESVLQHLADSVALRKPSNRTIRSIGIDAARRDDDETVIAVLVDEASLINWVEFDTQIREIFGSGQEPRIIYLGEKHEINP